MMDDYRAKMDCLREAAVARALDALLGDREAVMVSRVRLEAALDALAVDVAAGVTDMAHMGLVDTAQAAETLGITPRRVRALAASRNLGWQTARDWVFRPTEIEQMRERTPGRPPRARYTIETGPSRLSPARTSTSRAGAEHEAREIALGYGDTLDWIEVRRGEDVLYRMVRDQETQYWHRDTAAETA